MIRMSFNSQPAAVPPASWRTPPLDPGAWRKGAQWRRGLGLPLLASVASFALSYRGLGFDIWDTLAISLVIFGGMGVSRVIYVNDVLRRAAERRASDVAELYRSSLRCLAAAIDARDAHTRDHVRLVEFVAMEIASEMNLSADEREGIRTAALLLDVGTLGVPENILLQSGRPSAEEFAAIHNHPILGAEILEEVPFPWPVQRLIRAHHERWDGTGYPDRLKGEEIPLGARILAVADVYGALVSNRSFRRGWPHEQALAHIRRSAGTHFDPEVVKVFLRIAYRIPREGLSRSVRDSERAATSIARATQEFVWLWDISQSANSTLDLRETLQTVARKVAEHMDCDACAIFLKDQDGVGLTCQAEYPGEPAVLQGAKVKVGDPGTGQVARDGRPAIIRPGRDSVRAGDGTPSAVPYDWAAISPLGAGSASLGTINLYRSGRDFSIEELDLLNSLARHAAVPLANASLYESARQGAERDALTGLHNVRYLCTRVEQEFARSSRSGRPFSIIAVDLDNFKSVNDTLGHQAGDALLRDVSQLLASAVRDYDSVVRYGGDEFVIVLSEASEDDARETIARLDRLVTEYASGLPGLAAIGFGASFGAATFPRDGSDMKALLEVADARMYNCKRSSRASRQAA